MNEVSESFALAPSHFAKLRRTALTTLTPLVVGIVAFATLAARSPSTGWGTTAVDTVIFLAVLLPVLYFSHKKQIARAATFRLTVSDREWSRTQDGHDDVRISTDAVRKVVRVPGRGLLVYADGPQAVLVIPETLERFDECCSLLGRAVPVEDQRKRPLPRELALVALIPLMIAFWAFVRSTDPTTVLILGVLISAGLLTSLVMSRGNPELDRRTRRMWWPFLMAILWIFWRVWMISRGKH